MSAWQPCKDKMGGLPNNSFILRKPESLGTEFKTMACSVAGNFRLLLFVFLLLFNFNPSLFGENI
jgi:hypothetical protein